jgi:MFS family permease
MSVDPASRRGAELVDSSTAWWRLVASVAFGTIAGVGLWSMVVSLPEVETEFGLDRGSATLPYTLVMIGFALGGVIMGRLSDRVGIMVPGLISAAALGIGYVAAAASTTFWQFSLVHGVLIGFLGSATAFGPIVADISLWFAKRRGFAVAVAASGSYFAGTFWPPVLQAAIDAVGWRQAHVGVGLFCVVTLVPLAIALRRRPPLEFEGTATGPAEFSGPTSLSPKALQALIVFAGIACCVAMSMPQVHIVAYCGDLGYGPARGAEMLALMLAAGIISRVLSGMLADRIGGIGTLIVGSALQGLALLLYLPFDGLASLYVVSALFGLAQGGIVPSYAIIVREYFPTRGIGQRIGMVFMATILGMAFGGWLSGVIFDLTGSYRAAFLNGIAWNLVNLSIAFWLFRDRWRWRAAASA